MGTLYVHLDNTSNCVTSKGLSHSDFCQSIGKSPQNILLLDSQDTLGEYESRTGLSMIRTPERVEQYFRILNNQHSKTVKWIDFYDIQLIKELSPLEISELLYFGHMRTHLHSPFFYKLQNNFVYFEAPNQLTKIYFRQLDEFYAILATRLTQLLTEVVNSKKPIFRKAVPVEAVPSELLQQLKPILQEGIIFDTQQKGEGCYEIHAYVVEDRVKHFPKLDKVENLKVATLRYYKKNQIWEFDKDEEYFAYIHPFKSV